MNNPVSKTAYYTLACRFWDSKKPDPVCNDTFAHVFMNKEVHEVAEGFKSFSKPNGSIVVRHRIISEWIDQELIQNPSLKIFNIGCGFDTRPFRYTAGQWIEVDEPAVITTKNELLPPSQTKKGLTRIPVEFAHESLKEKLLPFKTSDKVLVVAEGVTMYLEEAQQQTFLHTLKELFPRHTLICDIMTLSFFKKYSQELSTQINSLGAYFKGLSDKPEAIFHASGYQTKRRISSPLRSAELGAIKIPAWLIRYFFPTLRDGLCVYEFQYGKD